MSQVEIKVSSAVKGLSEVLSQNSEYLYRDDASGIKPSGGAPELKARAERQFLEKLEGVRQACDNFVRLDSGDPGRVQALRFFAKTDVLDGMLSTLEHTDLSHFGFDDSTRKQKLGDLRRRLSTLHEKRKQRKTAKLPKTYVSDISSSGNTAGGVMASNAHARELVINRTQKEIDHMQDQVTHGLVHIGFRPSRTGGGEGGGPLDSIPAHVITSGSARIKEIHATEEDAVSGYDHEHFVDNHINRKSGYGRAGSRTKQGLSIANALHQMSRSSLSNGGVPPDTQPNSISVSMNQTVKRIQSLIAENHGITLETGVNQLGNTGKLVRESKPFEELVPEMESDEERGMGPRVEDSESEAGEVEGVWYDHWHGAEEKVYEDMIRKSLWDMGFQIGDANITLRPAEEARTAEGARADAMMEEAFAMLGAMMGPMGGKQSSSDSSD